MAEETEPQHEPENDPAPDAGAADALRAENEKLAAQVDKLLAAEAERSKSKADADAESLRAKGEHKALADTLAQQNKALAAELEGYKAKTSELDADAKWARDERKRQDDATKAAFGKLPKTTRERLGASASVADMRAFLKAFDPSGAGEPAAKVPASADPAPADGPPGDYLQMTPEQRKEARRAALRSNGQTVSVPWGTPRD